MGKGTEILWCDHTFNGWIGCTKKSEGCKFCYAETLMVDRFKRVQWGVGAERKRTSAANWGEPIKWNREAFEKNIRYKVFCSSLSDVFDHEVPKEWRRDLYRLFEETPCLDWLLLTKRIEDVHRFVPVVWREGEWPANVWLGTTMENQLRASERINILTSFPAPVRFVSIEPMLGPINLQAAIGRGCRQCGGTGEIQDSSDGGLWVACGCETVVGLDWVIAGGESGKDARPMLPSWARSLRDQCNEVRLPFLFKQWGMYRPAEGNDFTNPQGLYCFDEEGKHISLHNQSIGVSGEYMIKATRKIDTGRLLDGVEHVAFPTPKARVGNLYKAPESEAT